MQAYIYFLSAIFLVIATLLLIYNWKYNKNIVFLSIFLGLSILEFILASALHFNGKLSLMAISTFYIPLLYIKAPMFFFYIRGIVYDDFIIKKTDILHFTPFIFYLIINIPFLIPFLDPQSVVANSFELQSEVYKKINITFYPISWNNILISIQLFIYMIGCFILLNKSHKISRNMYAQYKYQYRYIVQKLYFITTTLLIISGLDIINDLIYPFSSSNFKLINLILFGYGLIAIYFLITPKLLYGLPHVETTHISATNLDKLKEGADGM